MKKTILILLLSFLSQASFSQDRFAIEGGVGFPTFHGSRQDQLDITSYNSFTAQISYMRKIYKHVYVGANLSYQRYNFIYDYDVPLAGNEQVTGITADMKYLFFAPTIDIGVGRRREIFHFYLTAAVGCLLMGNQTSQDDYFYSTSTYSSLSNTNFNSDDRIKKFVFHTSFGFEEHIPITKLWHILINEGFSLYSSNMTALVNDNAGTFFPTGNELNIHPGHFSLQIGLMRKYHKAVQPDAAK